MRYAPVQALLGCAALLLLPTLAPAAEEAKMYHYVDANGVHHYTNAPSDARYKLTNKPAQASRPSAAAKRTSGRSSSPGSVGRAARISNEERLLRAIAERSSSARPKSRAGGEMHDRFFFDEYAAGLRGRGSAAARAFRSGYGDYGSGVGYGGLGNYNSFSRRRGGPFSYTYTTPARGSFYGGHSFADYYFARGSYPATPEHINEHIRQAARTYGLDPMLIKAVIKTESNFNVNALSPKGARGLMQLMPGTARDMNVRNAFDPRDNIFGGARYLRMMLDQFGGDVALSLAAYNAGPNRVAATWSIPNIAETKNYVVKVMRHYRAYRGGAEARPLRPRQPNAIARVFARNTVEDGGGSFAPSARPASSIRVGNMVTTQ